MRLLTEGKLKPHVFDNALPLLLTVILSVVNLTACTSNATTRPLWTESKKATAQPPAEVRTTQDRTIKGDYAQSNLFANLPNTEHVDVKTEIEHRLNRHPSKVDLALLQLTVTTVTKDDLSPFNSQEAINSVTSLLISRLGITDEALESLSGLRLKDLILTEDPVKNLHALTNMQSLRHLGVSETQIDQEGMKVIARLINLETIWFDKTTISDADLSYLYGLKNLRQLSLIGCRNLSAQAVDKLKHKLPKCCIPSP